ncbi:MAG: hypothetical protein QNK05_03135 [Myxococcota bacterium]|nr:hypothetical protein [Myxococcota bacterium]
MSEAGDRGGSALRFAALLAGIGIGALVIETIWMRWLRLHLGATAPAVSATLVATFLGQGLGALVGARLSARPGDPLRRLARASGVAVALAACVPLLLAAGWRGLEAVYDAARELPALLVGLRLVLALLATLPAAAALGVLLPLVFQAGVPASALGSRGGAFYGIEVLAAALGVALATFVLPDLVGIRAAYAVGVLCIGGVGLTAALGGRSAREREPGSAPPAGASPFPVRLLILAGLSGFGSFAAQVLAVQAFALVHNQSAHAFGSVLIVVLCGLGVAALGVSRLARVGLDSSRLLTLALGAAALGTAAFPWLFVFVTGGLAYLQADAPWPGYLLRALALAGAAAGPLALCAGGVLPALLAHAERSGGDLPAGARFGRLLAANTLGAVLGALCGPWLLLPLFGPWGGFLAIAFVYAVAFVVTAAGKAPALARAAVAAAAVAAIALAGGPGALPLVPVRADEELLHVEPTADGLVAVVARDGQRRIQIDNHYMLGGAADRVHQERQGHVPLLLRPGAERVAFLGAATGSSASAALAHRPETLAVVELVPAVARLARDWLEADGGAVYGAPMADVVLDDARNFMRATSERYDVVVADLFLPWRAGAGALYAAEHYRAVRERLRPGGLFCQWLPLYQLSEAEFLLIAATFSDAFPNGALFRGDFYGRFPIVALVGYRDVPASAASVATAAAEAARAGVRDRWVIHPDAFFSLYVGPLGSLAGSLRDHPRNTDDRPRLEMGGARAHAGRKQRPFVGRAFASFAEQVAGRRGDADPIFPDLWPAARRAREGGLQLQAAGALFVEGRHTEASRTLGRAADLLPRAVLADAPPDPTAAELWWAEP